jgi:putative (di)nucleoside polyphosphate hydrolase
MPARLDYRPCVGTMVLNAEGRVWIGRRHDAPNEPEGPGSWWQMPQGGIDAEETASAAALRELYEETGIRSVQIIAESAGWYSYDLPENLRPRAWGGRYRGQTQKWFLLRFAGDDTEVAIARPPGQQTEFEAWRWAPASELVGLIVPFKRAVYEQVLREFAPLLRPQA